MVEAVVAIAVKKLGDVLTGETFFLVGVGKQVEGLRDELKMMHCFLIDADAKEQQGDELVRNWIADIRNIAYDVEDVIDTFILKVDASRTKGIKTFIIRKALMLKNMIYLHRVGNEILAIQARLKAISDRTITYGIKGLGGNEASSSKRNQKMMQLSQRNRYVHVEDTDVIGFDEYTKKLLAELMKAEEGRFVVSIVGPGGVGKTTLAKKIYRHDTVTSHFDCFGWSSISQQLNVKDALGQIAKKCMFLSDDEYEKIKVLHERDLIEKIYIYLHDKRYFIVLDDVWELDHWKSLRPAFPTGKTGSKILLTTRKKDVALQVEPGCFCLEPQPLTDAESWELLCRKTFPRNIVKLGCYPSVLEQLGKEMVHKCGGLPLGICVLGGLLATKGSETKQWELVHRDVIAHINNDKRKEVNEILALSYHDLPSYLKPCFLYLGLFPKDYAIPRKKLIQLWVAEGFISHAEENLLTMEDIGKYQYLAELTQRCMIQLDRGIILEKGDFGTICRVHDLMRDFCVSKAKEINFLNIYNLQHSVPGDIQTSHLITTHACKRVRRYAAHLNDVDISARYDINFTKSDCSIRTLIVVVPCVYRGIPLAPINYQNIKLLRVLDLGYCGKGHTTDITKEVSKLFHLRYLNLGKFIGCSVSSSIDNLQNLQTLTLVCYEGNLPETISNLVQLRHLNLFKGSVHKNFRIENLINLQTLRGIKAGEWIRKGCLKKLSNLRNLYVHSTSQLQTDIIVDEFVGKRSSLSSASSSADQDQIPIRCLSIISKKQLPNSIFDSLSFCHYLHTLFLHGRLDIVKLRKYPPSLTKLHLTESIFTEDPMVTLQYLPKLRVLDLTSCLYEGKEMVCSSNGFPQLQYLVLHSFKNVEEWRVDQGGMPHLKELEIQNCTKLSMLPEGLKFITTLEKLKIQNMPLVQERVVEGREDWYKVQHTPSIIVSQYYDFFL